MANTPQVVKIEDVGKYVSEVIQNLNAELFEMTKRGFFVEMPEELTFDMVVLKEFEALTSTDKETSKGNGTQTGTTKEEDSSTTIDHGGSEVRVSKGENHHLNEGASVTTTKQIS